MKLMVIGAGMMGRAAACDMARATRVEAVTLVDIDGRRAVEAAQAANRMAGARKVVTAAGDAADPRSMARLMAGYQGVLSCVPYFYNLGLAEAAIEAGCHFADLGGNNRVVRQELALSARAEARCLRLAPDCGLSPGLASILGGELLRRVGGRADALRIYVGGLPARPRPPFNYQLVFSVEGLINEYAEPCWILREGRETEVEPLSELEEFSIGGMPPLEAFHTSGGTSTMPETLAGRVGECFEKTLRYAGHCQMLRSLRELGLFSAEPVEVGADRIVPRRLLGRLFEQRFAGEGMDLVILRVEAQAAGRVATFTVIERGDRATGLTAMMRTTAWPASIVLQMMVAGAIGKCGAIYQEMDVPFGAFAAELAARGIGLELADSRELSRAS